jgi:uncharacterized sporulation protein YeaH/YhbH (DUF444 family)
VRISTEIGWYDLFSRGARDWLRHNVKVREAVEQSLPNMISDPDLLSRGNGKMVQVPVRLLEHARFRLRDPESETGAGQGAAQAQPGQVMRPGAPQPGQEPGEGKGGSGQGEVRFVLELKVDDIVDYLWEKMKLPELKPRQSPSMDDAELVREGWDKRGARSRLDRRRTVKEAVKRRSIQHDPAPFTNDDLRFRQLVRRPRPATNAVVIFAIDVSGSMGEAERQLAKTFFFFALQGIRRQYAKVETVFLAHAEEAWEFNEAEFFQTSGTGGTVTSSVLNLTREVLRTRYDPGQYNVYLFYASDGDNFSDDREPAAATLRELLPILNYTGYVEVRPSHSMTVETETSGIFGQLQQSGLPVGIARLTRSEEVWDALRLFFQQQAEAA